MKYLMILVLLSLTACDKKPISYVAQGSLVSVSDNGGISGGFCYTLSNNPGNQKEECFNSRYVNSSDRDFLKTFLGKNIRVDSTCIRFDKCTFTVKEL